MAELERELKTARKRLEIIGATVGDVNIPRSQCEMIDMVLDVINGYYDNADQPCEDCKFPLINGDGLTCENCGSKIPKPDPPPAQFVAPHLRGMQI